jgi:hypothetical protein
MMAKYQFLYLTSSCLIVKQHHELRGIKVFAIQSTTVKVMAFTLRKF